MASPSKSSDKQDAGEGSGAPRQQQQIPPPAAPPTQQVQGGDTVTVAGTQTEEVPVSTGTVTIIVPPQVESSRKRDRNEGGGSSSAAGGAGGGDGSSGGERRQKKKGELVEIPRGPPVCYVCSKEFQSWKAVFGHMRAHKIGEERARSGAFPPPVFTPPGSPEREQQALQQQLAPTLLNIAQEVLLTRPSQYSTAAAAVVRPHIDLNVPNLPSPSPSNEAEPEPEPEPAAEPSPPSTGGDKFDLNMPPKNGGDN